MKNMPIRAAVAACAMVVAGVATAAPVYPTFTVDTTALGGGGTLGSFLANDIGGQYHEQLTFLTASTFAVTLNFTAQGFNYDDTDPSLSTSLSAKETGLGFNYGLLAIVNGTGTYSTSGSVTTFTLASGGDLTLSYDQGALATFNAPTVPGGAYTINAKGDVITTLATGAAISGSGSESCTAANLCGAFGQQTSFALTAAGASFFVSPGAFYPESLQSGQFEGLPVRVGQTVTSTGTLNAVFASAVPEPASFTMMGLGLAGLAAGLRRRNRR